MGLLSRYLGHGGKKAIKHAAEIAYSTIDIMTATQASLLLQSVRVSVSFFLGLVLNTID
jgi:hypothetical protein